MSSMLTPFERVPKPSDETIARQERPQTNDSNMASQAQLEQERIPTYAESSTCTSLSPAPSPLPPFPAPTDDLPPAYSPLDAAQTTFMIYGTFIHSPAGPSYHLSSSLDVRGNPFRIRRLRPREIALVGTQPIAFDKTYTLYEIHDPPLVDHEYHLFGKRKGCLPGRVELKFGLKTWHVKHYPTPTSKSREILTSKRVGSFGRTTLNRKREEEASEWKDGKGRVVATELLRKIEGDVGGGVVPVIELSKDLDQTWRELVLSLWAARLWVAFGKEKSHLLGGRVNGQWVKLSGAAVLGAGAGLLGGAVVAT